MSSNSREGGISRMAKSDRVERKGHVTFERAMRLIAPRPTTGIGSPGGHKITDLTPGDESGTQAKIAEIGLEMACEEAAEESED
jgi:hypothetical protein